MPYSYASVFDLSWSGLSTANSTIVNEHFHMARQRFERLQRVQEIRELQQALLGDEYASVSYSNGTNWHLVESHIDAARSGPRHSFTPRTAGRQAVLKMKGRLER